MYRPETMTQIKMLLPADAPSDTSMEFRFGGRPLLATGTEWPTCKHCNGAMCFLGQIPHEQHLLSVFMCDNNPGMCEQWDPEAGGNTVIASPVDGGLELVDPPSEGETLLWKMDNGTKSHPSWGATTKTVEVDDDELDEDDDAYMQASEDGDFEDIGYLGGDPSWIQGEETPSCASCNKPMTFVAGINEGPDEGPINLGDAGMGYVFACACGQARFLWQGF
jgi:hypothetical protein